MEISDSYRQTLKKMPYQQFLETGYWIYIRGLIRDLAGDCCEMCGDSRQVKLHVHHRTYANRGWEDQNLGDLILLCEDCHEDVHRKGLEGWPVNVRESRFSEVPLRMARKK